MPLKDDKISINLNRGMREDMDSFILEPPHVEYAENIRLYKEGCIAKRRGNDVLPDNEKSTSDGVPSVLHASGNTLTTLTDNSVLTYDADSQEWTERVIDAPLWGVEKTLSTNPARGACNFSMVQTSTGYYVAFEVRQTGFRFPFSYVLIQYFNLNGDVLWEKRIANAVSPQLVATANTAAPFNFVRLFYSLSGFVSSVRIDDIGNIDDTEVIGVCATSSPIMDLYADNDDLTNGINDRAFFDTFVRVGFCKNAGVDAQYAVHMTSSGGVCAILENDHKTITAYQLNSSGRRTLDTWAVQATASSVRNNCLLDVRQTSDGQVHCLFSRYDFNSLSSPRHFTTSVWYFNHDWGANTTRTLQLTSFNGTCTQGAISPLDGANSVWVAYRVCENNDGYPRHGNENPNLDIGGSGENDGTTPTETYLRYAKLSSIYASPSSGTQRIVGNHQLASNIVKDNSNNMYVVLEQFGAFQTWTEDTWAGENGLSAVPAAIKQCTGQLVRLRDSTDNVQVCATFDAGQSKHSDAAVAETRIHKNTLEFIGDSLYYLSRNLYSPESFSHYIDSNWDASSSGSIEGEWGFSLALGEARGNLYRLSSDIKIQGTNFGDGLLVNTALPLWIDQGSLMEASVLEQPEIVRVDSSKATHPKAVKYTLGGSSKHILLQAVVGFTDHAGNIHRSSPSEIAYVVGIDPDSTGDQGITTAGEGELSVWITPPLSVNTDERSYFVELYTAQEGQTPKLAVHRSFRPKDVIGITNGIRVDYNHVLYAGSGGTEVFPARNTQQVYTTGDRFASDPWFAFGSSVVTSRRMFALSSTLPGTVFWSLLFEENIAPEFTAAGVISLGDARDLKAIGEIDDKVVVFEKDKIHVIFGDGPDNTGRGADFGVQHLQTDIGCEDQESVVEIPQGLMFYSSVSKEFHLLDRNLVLHNIGAPVQGLTTNIEVKSATVVPSEHEVRFLVTDLSTDTAQGPDPDSSIDSITVERPPRPVFRNKLPSDPCLVYNYERDAWWVSTPYTGLVSTLFQNEYTYITRFWTVVQDQENGWQYVPNNSGGSQKNLNRMLIRTPWFKFDGLQGFVRLRKATFLGRYMSDFSADVQGDIQAGDIKVTPYYDYEATTDSPGKVYRANVELQPNNDRFQFQYTGKQKCQAIRFDIEEVVSAPYNVDDPTFSLGRGFELTGIDLEVALKDGTVKTLSSRRKGGQ